MAKKMLASIAGVALLLTVIFVITAFATAGAASDAQEATNKQISPIVQTPVVAQSPNTENSGCDYYAFLLDEKGELVSESVLKENVDKAVADGTIKAEDRAYILEMYSFMSANGGGMDACPMMGGEGEIPDDDGCPMIAGGGGCPMLGN